MPGVLGQYALIMERTQDGPFLSVEIWWREWGSSTEGECRKSCATPAMSLSLEGRSVFDDGKRKRPTARTTQLSLFVPSTLGNYGLTKDGK